MGNPVGDLFQGAGDIMGNLSGQDAAQPYYGQIGGNLDDWLMYTKGLDPNQIKDQGQSAFTNISTDPTTRDAQMQALAELSQIGREGGLDPQSKAAIDQAMSTNAAQENSRRQAMLQNFQARGLGGSGADIASELQADQSDANSGAMASEQAAADARTRAMSAMGQAGNLAGNIRGQDWSEAARRAEALDSVNRFNAEQSGNRYKAEAEKSQLMGQPINSYDDYLSKQAAQAYATAAAPYKFAGQMGGDIASSAASGYGYGGGGGGSGGGGGGMGMGGMNFGQLGNMMGGMGGGGGGGGGGQDWGYANYNYSQAPQMMDENGNWMGG